MHKVEYESFLKLVMNNMMKINTKKNHHCYYKGCTASFSRPYKLEFHIKKHEGEVKQCWF